ncbi:hypothetical protein AYJ54_36355 [Bradyrhizobium centrolobii]|uniref:Type I restriction modification DNA specificity domain-containing protein n=1 Tax=Bradyrhizobium centrolobii TaxID=1505087 RepID=A0A176Y5P1_9BRAD|nr:restriction endonuclease subunit S [Bradyrhizobium centrolobii]OAE96755.1 hypothetical protein AYJ54_36355 [Bradyrhizobium centrolobii]
MSGEAQAGWRAMLFSEAVAINPKRQLPREGQVPFLDMASLPLNGADVSVLTTREISSGGSKFQSGDTLFARITPCAENGKLGFVQSINGGQVAQGSTEFIVMAGRDGLTLPEYVRCLAGWSEVRDQAIGLMEGTSGRQRVPQSAFDEIEVLIPPLEEQRRIAEVLRSVDELLSVVERKAEQGERTLSAYFAEAFANAVPQDGTGVALDDLLSRIIDYRGVPPPKAPSGVPLLTAKNVRFGYLDPEPREFIAEDDYESWMRRGIPAVGDVMFTTEAPLGNVADFPNYRAALGQRTLTLRPDPVRLTSSYLKWLLLSPYAQTLIERHATGSTAKGIKQTTFRKLRFNVPSLANQSEIGAVCDSIWADVVASRAQSSALIKLRGLLSGDLLSGRVKVPVPV